jgi:uncharacterized protein
MRQTVAIVGTGIAGMACARSLSDQFDLTLFEKNDYFGGHTNTVIVTEGRNRIPIDTGFMVYNEATYPNLVKLFDELGVQTMETDMSFGVQQRDQGLEYACTGLSSFFAQRKNYGKPGHWRLLAEILRFFKVAKAYLSTGRDQTQTLSDFLREHQFKAVFIENYLLPMTAAIWSTPPNTMLNYPAKSLLGFLDNHRLLGVGIQLKWRTVRGGSKNYREKMLHPLRNSLRRDSCVISVNTNGETVQVRLRNGQTETFDNVVVATHADQALALLSEPSEIQKSCLGTFRYTTNPVILHSDSSVMPLNRRAWASWNFRMEDAGKTKTTASTHYWMNRLQKVSDEQDYFVSVNYDGPIDSSKIHWEYSYEHPTFTLESLAAQKQLPILNQTGPIYFCGSYFRNGFHEDALVSGLEAAKALKERSNKKHELLPV